MNRHALVGALAVAALGGIVDAAELTVPEQFVTIQAAIDAAQPGDTVLVSDGTYTGTGNREINFGGKAVTLRSVNGPERTIIQVAGSSDNPFRGFVFTSGETAATVVDGFTVTGGATLPGAIADQFNGGAMLCNNESSPTIKNCILTGNSCGCWGAAICCTNASPTIINCEITGNSADDDGGGIFAWSNSSPTIINSLIRGNSAPGTGGGLTLFSGNPTVINSTIVDNTAGFGAGLYIWDGALINSIVWGNHGDQINANAGNSTIRYSNIEGGFEGIGNVNVDPMFVSPATGDYHLAAGSPLVNAGNNTILPASAATDMDGDVRVVGLRVDIGADEHRFAGDLNADGGVDVTDLVQLILAWGPCANDCVEDITNDDVVDVSDLVELILDWPV